MDALREAAPFLVGTLTAPLVTLAAHGRWSGGVKSVASFVVALALGLCASVVAGELAAGMPGALIAVMIDTSLAYTGSQVAYRLVWKPVIEARGSARATSEARAQ